MELVLRTRPGVRKCAAVSNRSACSMILWPLTEPHYTMWCQPGWSWCSDTSEWQACGVRKSFPHWYRNTLRSNREGDAGDCLRSWAFQPIHIWSTCIHRKWPQATRNNSTETICPNTSKPPVNDDAAIEIRFHRVLWADTLSRAYLPYKGKEVDDIESVSVVRYLPSIPQGLCLWLDSWLYIFCCRYHSDYCSSFIDRRMSNWPADRFVLRTHWFRNELTSTFFFRSFSISD